MMPPCDHTGSPTSRLTARPFHLLDHVGVRPLDESSDRSMRLAAPIISPRAPRVQPIHGRVLWYLVSSMYRIWRIGRLSKRSIPVIVRTVCCLLSSHTMLTTH